jgi:hypothetical protein
MPHMQQRQLGPEPDEELLVVHPRPGRRLDVRRDLLIAHREHARRHPHRRGHAGRDLAQLQAVTQHAGPQQMGPQVVVAQVEPHRFAEAAQRLHTTPRLALLRPAALVATESGQGEQSRVETGADPQPVDPEVVGDVDDQRRIPRPDARDQTVPEPRGADSPAKPDDLHDVSPADAAMGRALRSRTPSSFSFARNSGSGTRTPWGVEERACGRVRG